MRFPTLIFLVLAVLAPSCAVPPQTAPKHLLPDTRMIVQAVFSDTIAPAMEVVADSVVEGNPELARCFYGGVFQRGQHLFLKVERMAAPPTRDVSDTTVTFECPPEVDGFPLVADMHSHPDATIHYLCIPSEADFIAMLEEERLLFTDILCSSGIGYREWRDGRWEWFRWRPNAD